VHLAEHGKLTLDSKRIKGSLEDFLQRENRFSSLTRKNPKASEELHHHLQVTRATTTVIFCYLGVDRILHAVCELCGLAGSNARCEEASEEHHPLQVRGVLQLQPQ
jgi:hypothetical protein